MNEATIQCNYSLGRLDDLKRATKDKAYQEQLMIELLPAETQNI